MRAPFIDQLEHAWAQSNSFLCVGLDPLLERLPQPLRDAQAPFLSFGRAIVDATHPFVCAYKPQIAHFAAEGRESELRELIRYIHESYPGIPVILDAKRGDVGSTAERYAVEAFERYDADAVTVNPYLGWDSIAPFAEYRGRGVIVLCHTSNPDAGWLQEYPESEPVFMRVARLVQEHDDKGDLMLVLGATYPELLRDVRSIAPSLPFLVPGIGSQGGDLEAVMRYGRTVSGAGLVINASRSVIYAGGADLAEGARDAACGLAARMRVSSG